MSISDTIGMRFVKASVKAVSKNKLLGIVSIALEKENHEKYPKESQEMVEDVKKEWMRRGYDEKVLAEYIAFCKESA